MLRRFSQRIKVQIGYPLRIESNSFAVSSMLHTNSLWNFGTLIIQWEISLIRSTYFFVSGLGWAQNILLLIRLKILLI
jgi:hypothetical protein